MRLLGAVALVLALAPPVLARAEDCTDPGIAGCTVPKQRGLSRMRLSMENGVVIRNEEAADDGLAWASGTSENDEKAPRVAIMEFGFASCEGCQNSREVLDVLSQACAGGTERRNVRVLESLDSSFRRGTRTHSDVSDRDVTYEDAAKNTKLWAEAPPRDLVPAGHGRQLMLFPKAGSDDDSIDQMDAMLRRMGTDASSLPLMVVLVNGRLALVEHGGANYKHGNPEAQTPEQATAQKRAKARQAANHIEDAVRKLVPGSDFKCDVPLADGHRL